MAEKMYSLEEVVAEFDKLGAIPLPVNDNYEKPKIVPQQYQVPTVTVEGVSESERKVKQPSSIDFMAWTIEKLQKIVVHLDEDSELWYRIFPVRYWVPAEESERSFLISEKSFQKQPDAFRIFSENGILINDTKRDALQRLRNILFSKAYERIEYPYLPGWHDDIFQYNNDTEMSRLVNTPFLSKKLNVDDAITQKKALDILLQQATLVHDKTVRAFIVLVLHYALLFRAVKGIPKLDMIFGIYGDRRILGKLAHLFFQFYNRETPKIHYLHDYSVVKDLKLCKDEVFVITDNNTDTPYNRKKAETNFSDVTDYVFGGQCNGVCLIVSDCGIVVPDEDIVHMTVFQKDIAFVENIQTALGTHIKFFAEWIAKNKASLENMCVSETLFSDSYKQELYHALDVVHKVLKAYYNHIGGENLSKFLGVKSDKEFQGLLKRMVYTGCADYQGEWICDSFKEIFDHLNLQRVYPKENPVNYDSEEPFVYVRKDSVCFRRKDMNLFLNYFPKGMRIVDILKTLKKYDYLETDDAKRYEKNVMYQGKPRKMIVISKEFLIPSGLTIEGGW